MSMYRGILVATLAVFALLVAPAAAQGSQFALRFYATGTNQQDRVRIQVDDNVPGPAGNTPLDVGQGSFTIEMWLRG